MSEELYELLKERDAELAALRAVVDDLINEYAAMYAEAKRDEADAEARSTLRDVYYQRGFKSDGRWRG